MEQASTRPETIRVSAEPGAAALSADPAACLQSASTSLSVSLSEGAAYLALNFLLSVYRLVAIPHVRALHLDRISDGPKVLAPNHDYMSDAFVLPAVIPGRLAFLIQAAAFGLPIVGRLLSASGQIPVEPAKPARSLQLAAERLGQGWSIVVFSEGHLNHGGLLGRAYSGAIRLSQGANVSLVPIGLHAPAKGVRFFHGRYAGRWTSAGWQVRGVCAVAIGHAWQPFAGASEMPAPVDVRAAADELRDRIHALSMEAKQEAESCVSLW